MGACIQLGWCCFKASSPAFYQEWMLVWVTSIGCDVEDTSRWLCSGLSEFDHEDFAAVIKSMEGTVCIYHKLDPSGTPLPDRIVDVTLRPPANVIGTERSIILKFFNGKRATHDVVPAHAQKRYEYYRCDGKPDTIPVGK